MRYYNFTINSSTDYIDKNTKIRLRDYYFDNTIGAVNNYMYKNLTNNITFFIYREDNETLPAVFCFDEQQTSYEDAYDTILGMLKDTFLIKKIAESPNEITMYQYLDAYYESRRRDFHAGARIVDNSNLWLHYYLNTNDIRTLKYTFDEDIISDKPVWNNPMYDKLFRKEIENIQSHSNPGDFNGNMVHYVISARSMDAARDMTKTLMQALGKAGRVSGRRVEILTNIEPDIYKNSNNHIEDIIENNYGGAVIFDLSVMLGNSKTDYVMAGKYLESLFKRYRNKCLFIFTYNMDDPGFSYYLLPQIKEYAMTVTLREGRGDRKAAVKYMKSLIEDSFFAKYSSQADEYMKLFPGNNFTQTDVLAAYDKFDSWCMNKNIFKAYSYDMNEGFMLDRDENDVSPYDKLQKLIGLDIVKKQIDSIIALDIAEKERRKVKGNEYKPASMHMIFKGAPGTAKTTVAKLFAGIAKEKGILKSGAFVECGGMDLDGPFAAPIIRGAFLAAKGGVLFIDEAYTMRHEAAIATLIQEMENRRDEVVTILAGYGERMQDFLERNEGLKSRIPHIVEFPDYSADELTDIFKLMIEERGFTATDEAINEAHYILDKARLAENFGNGRYCRNLIERVSKNIAMRVLPDGKKPKDFNPEELFHITKDDICMLDEGLTEERPAGTARRELEEMIGLASTKKIINKAVANFKLNKLCQERSVPRKRASYHMVFTGNPGTAKTTVARLLAEILKDENVLSTGVFVEAGRADLVGDHVGATAIQVKRKFKEAQGGVLFIDEAYSLCDGHENSFGDEAINTIVQEMENNRDRTIVIFAGYPKPMKNFIDRNPGMKSRIAFHVSFDDYSTDELCEITKLMLSKNNMEITDAAMDKLKRNYEEACKSTDFGNGRFVRSQLEEAGMNLAQRLMKMNPDDITEKQLITLEECDIPDYRPDEKSDGMKMGFAC